MKIAAIVCLFSLLVLPGMAPAEQVRLVTGDFLQGEINGDQSDEDHLTIRLFSTGGVIRLRWDQLIVEDQKRLRDSLGLSGWDDEEDVLIDGHTVIFKNGSTEEGFAENPDELSAPLVLRTASGLRTYPRDTIAKIISTLVPALAVYTPDQMYEQYLEEYAPESGAQHADLARMLVRVEAYRQALEHFNLALEDEDYAGTEQAQMVRNLLAKVEVYVKAEEALDRVRAVKRLYFQKRYDDALTEIQQLKTEYEEDPAILKILSLERLETQVVSGRRSYYQREVRRLFFRMLDDLVNRKIREKDSEDREKDIGLNAVKQWVGNPQGLTQEIFGGIAEKTGLSEQEAREFWDSRKPGQVKRYNYGQGTFVHPEVAAKVSNLIRPKSTRRTSRSSRNPRQAAPRRGSAPKLKTADEWWEGASNKARRDWTKAWYAENGQGVLQVLRIETRVCPTCKGLGYKVVNSVNNAEETKTVCLSCNLAQHERIVIYR
jgi:tetratricopeptide (TPR) repeat protein